ncbi:S1 family peptidase [Methylomagnum sp.]
MRHAIMLGLLLSAGLCPGIAGAELDHTMSLSVVQVRAYPGPGKMLYGSGVVVGPERVVTNCHVVRSALKVAVSKGPMLYPAVTQQADPRHDLCLLTTPNIPFPVAHLGSAAKLAVGQSIYFYGYPRAIGITFSEGKVQALHPFDGGRVIETSADFTLGASGGGVFDSAGKLVGLATFLTAGHAGGYYAIPADWISGLSSREARKIEPLPGLSFWEDAASMPAFLKPPGK